MTLPRLLTIAIALAALPACDDSADGYYGGAGDYAPPPSAPADGETYTDHGTNPFLEPAEDNLVTFAVDVDTGSYTLMRSSIEDGRLPSPASVRVEEFVNFFDYGDAPPEGDQEPFAARMEAAPSPFGEGLHLVRISLKGYEVLDQERPPANLVFLVDVSGSMNSSAKLGLVKHALRRLTETLRPDDTIGIVTYASNPGVALAPTPVREREAILRVVDGLSAGGSTNGEGGIRAAYDLAEQAMKPGGINRVLLCSDGDFNVGVRGQALIDLIERFRDRGITLSVFGFGRGNYNDSQMEQLADHGNGNYAFIDREVEVERVLVRGISGTLLVIAKDVKVQVEINPDLVARYRLIGYENRDIADDDFRDDAVDAGEIGAGHTVTAFIEVELVEGALESAADLATLRVRWKAPDGDAAEGESSQGLAGTAVVTDFVEASRALRFGAAVAEFAEILRESPHSDGARFGEVADIASAAARAGDAAQAELVSLVQRAAALR